MSLNWQWKEDRIGTWTEVHEIGSGETVEYKYNLYSGNALCIMVAEYTENGKDLYTVANFFCDKDHMKRCLGLTKDSDYNIFKSYLREIEIKADYKHTPFILQQLAKAKFDNDIKITLLQDLPW